MAVYLQWKRSHCPDVAPKAAPAPTSAAVNSSASTSFDTSLPATSSAADSDTTETARVPISSRILSCDADHYKAPGSRPTPEQEVQTH
jgi:hypothetical protein